MGAPLSYVVEAPRTGELVAWLKCNDVRPSDVPYPSEVFVETPDGEAWFIRFEAYVRSANGMVLYDAVTEAFEYVERSVPLVNDPPMWWLVEVAPTGGGATSAGPTGAETAAGEYTVTKRVGDGG